MDRIRALMADGQWRTFDEIAAATGVTNITSVSTVLRHLRQKKHGRYVVDRRQRGYSQGLYEYRVWRPVLRTPIRRGGVT